MDESSRLERTDPQETIEKLMCRDTDCACEKISDISSGLQKIESSAILLDKSKTDKIKVGMSIDQINQRDINIYSSSSALTLQKNESPIDSSSLQIQSPCVNEFEDEHRPFKKRNDSNGPSSSSSSQPIATKFSSVQDDSGNVKKMPQKMSSSTTNKSQTDAFREIRMERKRKREMQRRSSVNKELDNLAELINNINPPELKSTNDKFSEASTHPTLNRLDLIHVAVKVLGRLYQQTEQDAKRINDLTLELNSVRDVSNQNDKVNLMFPVMVPSNESSEGGNIGGLIPNGSVYLPPRLPNSYLNTNPPPTLHKGAPFPHNSIFSSSLSNFVPTSSQHLLNKINDHLPPPSYPIPNPNLFLFPDPRLCSSLEANRLLNWNQQDLEALLAAKLAEQLSKKPH